MVYNKIHILQTRVILKELGFEIIDNFDDECNNTPIFERKLIYSNYRLN